ncbi:transposase, partial [Pseudomonas sp. BW16M2]|uniref:transposase n=1 Tax=Pseudomonas sp. BW16M2 TaxID=2745489 RepID=UPI001EE2A038
GLRRLFDKPKYRQRNAIERLFGWLKEHRRLGTRYCKLAESFAAMVTLACWRRCIRHYFSYARRLTPTKSQDSSGDSNGMST